MHAEGQKVRRRSDRSWRLDDDDWQRETLPILLNVDDESIGRRTSFTNVRE